ncbi:MAG: WbuC family cupin fold metalloprotein [Planctomycetes bacterium]|nr:WbuC family cupin fold metalloprotein [Planctomycetota bacterium]
MAERFIETSPDVLYHAGGERGITADDLRLLAARARASARWRCRICLHAGPQAAIHEMFIAHMDRVHVPPHAHRVHDESFTVVEGLATVVLFDDAGGIERTVALGPPGSGRQLSLVVPHGRWHGQVFESEMVIFHEVTGGPFDPAALAVAPFAPDPRDGAAVLGYRRRILAAAQERP